MLSCARLCLAELTSQAMGKDPRSLPWYRPQIGARLKPRVRELFVEYVGLPPDEVESHILAIVCLSSFVPYPMIHSSIHSFG